MQRNHNPGVQGVDRGLVRSNANHEHGYSTKRRSYAEALANGGNRETVLSVDKHLEKKLPRREVVKQVFTPKMDLDIQVDEINCEWLSRSFVAKLTIYGGEPFHDIGLQYQGQVHG